MTDAPSGSAAPAKKAVGKGKAGAATEGGDGKKRFEVKKVRWRHSKLLVTDTVLMIDQWNAVALWAWDIVVDNCAICRNHIMDLCTPVKAVLEVQITNTFKASNVKPTKLLLPAKSVLLRGVFATSVHLLLLSLNNADHSHSMLSTSTASPGG